MPDTSPTRPASTPRIPPITTEECDEDAREFLTRVDGPKGNRGLSKLNIVRTLAHHPDLAVPYLEFGTHILLFSSLPKRLRKLATLRTAWLYDCEYEWKEHARNAARMDVTTEEVEATKIGSSVPSWSDLERSVLSAVEQLRYHTVVDDATWAVLAEHLERRQLLDLLFTVGSYAMLAMVLNSLRVEPEI